MAWIFYMLSSYGLFFWTTKSIKYSGITPIGEYLIGIILLTIFVSVIWKKDHSKKMRDGVIIAALFMNIGLSIAYRMSEESKGFLSLINLRKTYAGDLIMMLLVFLLVYSVVRWTKIYKFKTVNILILIGLPTVIFGARLSGHMVGGSYLYFAGIMIFGWVLFGFPFVAAFLIDQKEDFYWNGNVRNLSWNLMLLLLYTFILYIGCVVCNEFGLLLILGLTTTVLFFIRCKNGFTKIFYTVACAGGALLAGFKITHLWERILIWLHPSAVYGDANLGEKAESILYLFRHIYQMGWWGNGIGNLPKSIYPTLNTDHALVTLMNDYSVWMAISVLLLGIIFVRWMLFRAESLCTYDRYLNLTCALIVCFIILIDVASNLGSFITAGIGFPWISDGSSVNIMLTGLMAVHCGLLGKKVNTYAQNETQTF